MKSFLPATIAFIITASLQAAEQKPLEPHPINQTFFVTNVASDKDVASITESLKKVKSVTKVENLTPTSGYANVSFDSHANSFHEIAQSIADAGDKKFDVTIKLLVPDYAKAENAAKIDEIFAKTKNLVTVETTDKEKGEFVLYFLPLKLDPNRPGPQGWNMGKFYHPIHDPAPKGLGLNISAVRLNAIQPTAAPAK